ncbi:hypothetical protein [Amycolatopsis sp. NPDC051128]|uniref:hypothetical protein n=1 Tax=Amycolatopsis sp. NPDC051128 TaxID=3155412 RepID=UPI003441E23D
MIIVATRQMGEWAAEIRDDEVVFRFAPPAEDPDAAVELPRVWPGRGLGVLESALPGLRAALGEVMKTPRYWRGRAANRPGPGWQAPTRDPEDGFVYLAGPAEARSTSAGYQAVPSFTVALADIRDLRIRVTAYLAS